MEQTGARIPHATRLPRRRDDLQTLPPKRHPPDFFLVFLFTRTRHDRRWEEDPVLSVFDADVSDSVDLYDEMAGDEEEASDGGECVFLVWDVFGTAAFGCCVL